MAANDASPEERGGVLLSIVEGVFNLDGRGYIVFPGVPYPNERIPILRRGDSIVLRRPDGTEIQSVIREFEMIRRNPPTPFLPFLLPKMITKADVPTGTELWYFAPLSEASPV